MFLFTEEETQDNLYDLEIFFSSPISFGLMDNYSESQSSAQTDEDQADYQNTKRSHSTTDMTTEDQSPHKRLRDSSTPSSSASYSHLPPNDNESLVGPNFEEETTIEYAPLIDDPCTFSFEYRNSFAPAESYSPTEVAPVQENLTEDLNTFAKIEPKYFDNPVKISSFFDRFEPITTEELGEGGFHIHFDFSHFCVKSNVQSAMVKLPRGYHVKSVEGAVTKYVHGRDQYWRMINTSNKFEFSALNWTINKPKGLETKLALKKNSLQSPSEFAGVGMPVQFFLKIEIVDDTGYVQDWHIAGPIVCVISHQGDTPQGLFGYYFHVEEVKSEAELVKKVMRHLIQRRLPNGCIANDLPEETVSWIMTRLRQSQDSRRLNEEVVWLSQQCLMMKNLSSSNPFLGGLATLLGTEEVQKLMTNPRGQFLPWVLSQQKVEYYKREASYDYWVISLTDEKIPQFCIARFEDRSMIKNTITRNEKGGYVFSSSIYQSLESLVKAFLNRRPLHSQIDIASDTFVENLFESSERE